MGKVQPDRDALSPDPASSEVHLPHRLPPEFGVDFLAAMDL